MWKVGVLVLGLSVFGIAGEAIAITATATKTVHKIVFESGATFMTIPSSGQKVVGVPVKVGLSTGKKALWAVAGLSSAGVATLAGVLTDPESTIMSEDEEKALIAAYNVDKGSQLYVDDDGQIRDYATSTYSSSLGGQARWKNCSYDMWNNAVIDGFTVGTGTCNDEAAGHGWSCSNWVFVRDSGSYRVAGPKACSGSGTEHYENTFYLKAKTVAVSQTIVRTGVVVPEGTWVTDLEEATVVDPPSNTAKKIVEQLNGALGGKLAKAIGEGDTGQGLSSEQIEELRQLILDSVPGEVWDSVEEANNPSNLASSEQGSDDSAEAVKKGLEEYFSGESVNIGSISEEADPTVPEKESITSKLDSYWGGLQALPLVSGISSSTLNASGGNPVVSCDIPEFLNEGGHHLEFNFGGGIGGVSYADILGSIGSLMLAVATLRWGLYVLKSE